MAEICSDLIYEVLNTVQQRLTNLEAKPGEVDGLLHTLAIRMDGLRPEAAAAHAGIENISRTLSHSDARLARIGKRLELVEHAAEEVVHAR
jgi:hypothetical protein